MATIKVSNQTEFLSALKAAKGGDTILLADGHYGDLDLKNDYTSNVTIKSETPQGAEFSRLGLVGATNITVDGIHTDAGLAVKDGSKNISILNSDINGTLYTRYVDGLTIDNVDVSGGRYGILLNSVKNFSVTNSHVHEVSEDLMRITGNSYNGLIENNVIADVIASSGVHPDIIQFFHVDGVTPHDITIRGNVLYDDPTTGAVAAQGLFVSDSGRGEQNQGYSNILIEENLIKTNASNTIFINSGHSSVEILNNTLMSSGGGGNIRLVGKVFEDGGPVIDGNVFKALINETKSVTMLDNYVYGKSVDLSTLFSGTDGGMWKSYIPVAGSDIAFGTGYGAAERLIELIKAAGGLGNIDLGTVDAPAEPVDVPPADTAKIVYDIDKTYEIAGSQSWAKIVHNDAMELDEGSIALTFNADTVAGKRGVISKGAAGNYDDFSAYISDGKLIVGFENGKESVSITATGIKANTDYDLLITFDEEKVKVWLDDKLVGEADFDIDLSENSESLVIGGMNGQSTRGTTSRVSSFFDGTISDITFYDEALTPAEAAALDDAQHAQALEDASGLGLAQSDLYS